MTLTPNGSTLSQVMLQLRSTAGCSLALKQTDWPEGEGGVTRDRRFIAPQEAQLPQPKPPPPLLFTQVSRDSGTQKRTKRTSQRAMRDARVMTKFSLYAFSKKAPKEGEMMRLAAKVAET